MIITIIYRIKLTRNGKKKIYLFIIRQTRSECLIIRVNNMTAGRYYMLSTRASKLWLKQLKLISLTLKLKFASQVSRSADRNRGKRGEPDSADVIHYISD